jgi:hypothetical protein
MRSYLFWTTLAFLLCAAQVAKGQRVETDRDGNKRVVFEDGTWRPFTAADSVLLKVNRQDDFLILDDSGINVLEAPISSGAKATKNQKKQKSSTQKQLDEEIKKLEQKYQKFSLDPSIPEEDLNLILSEIETLKLKQQTSEKSPTPDAQQKSSPTLDNTSVSGPTNIQFASIPKSKSLLQPPPPNCFIKETSIDQFSKTKYVELFPTIFFSYTDPNLRSALKEKEFLTCFSHIIQNRGEKELYLTFVFSTTTAQREYGSLEKNTPIAFLLLNGQTISLKNNILSQGQVDVRNGTTYYQIALTLNKQAEKMLAKNPIDKIRVMWSSGYEDYDIWNINQIIDQINCINQ